MMTRKFLFTVAASVALIAAAASAQNNTTNTRQLNLKRASQIVGAQVQSQDNQNAGKITNLAINPDNGHVVFAIVGTQGDSGMAQGHKAVPFGSIHFQGDTAKLNVDLNRFKDAPPFDPSGWNTIGDLQWRQKVYEFYGMNSRNPNSADQRPDLAQATKLLKAEVHNRQQQQLGTIEDLMIDMNRNNVIYAVLTGVNGAANKMIAVPWKSLNYQESNNALVLNMNQNKLQNAPSVENNRWGQLENEQFANNVAQFYGLEPGAIYGYTSPNANDNNNNNNNNNGNSGGETLGGWQFKSQYDQLFNRSSIKTVQGEVTSVESVKPMPQMGEGIALQVRTNNNQTATVHLGPTWYIDHQYLRFHTGDKVTVTGSQVQVNGNSAIMAMEVRVDDRTLFLRDNDGTPRWDATFQNNEVPGNERGARGRGNENRNNNNNNNRGGNNRNNG